MKVLARTLSLFTLLAVATLYTSCGGGDDPEKTQEEIQLEKLKGTWTLTEADLEGDDRTADFITPIPMTITFSGTYSSGGTYLLQIDGSRPNPNPWDDSHNWKFGPDVTDMMIRIDPGPEEIGMEYILTDSQLIIRFEYPGVGFAGGRVEQVIGDWEFIFDKE